MDIYREIQDYGGESMQSIQRLTKYCPNKKYGSDLVDFIAITPKVEE